MRVKNLVIVILIIICICALVYFFSRPQVLRPFLGQQFSAKNISEFTPGVTIKGAKIAVRLGAKGLLKVYADAIEVNKDRSQTLFKGVKKGQIIGENNKVELGFSAGSMRLNSVNDNLEALGDVEVIVPWGLNLRTQRTYWIAKEEKLVCPGLVFVKVGKIDLWAPKLVFFSKDDEIVCPKGIQAVMGNDWLRADSLRVDLRLEEFYLDGNVRLRAKIGEVL